VLPWIGVIALGYVAGAWYAVADDSARRRALAGVGVAMLIAFLVVRSLNLYGDAP